MIRSFKHRGLKRLFEDDDARGVRADQREAVEDILARLDGAATLQALNLPGYHLHPLKGDLKGHWAVWVDGNWRITFAFDANNAVLVNYQDYH